MITRLVLIRHGTTEWNKLGRYCGYKDISLNSQGRAQSARLRNAFKDFKFDRIYSSDRKRALQTSRIIFNGSRITAVGALREINFGVLEGLSHQEIMKKHAGDYKKWLKNPFRNCIPGAEPTNVFKKRVHAITKKITCLNRGRTVAVVCHGGVIGMFVSGILKNKNFWRYVPSAASVTIVKYGKGKPQIEKFNDTDHLR